MENTRTWMKYRSLQRAPITLVRHTKIPFLGEPLQKSVNYRAFSLILGALDGRKTILFNANLLSQSIINYTRSRDFGFKFRIHVDIKTDSAVLKQFTNRIADFPKQHPQTWKKFMVNLDGLEHSHNLTISVIAFMRGITWAVGHLFDIGMRDFCLSNVNLCLVSDIFSLQFQGWTSL